MNYEKEILLILIFINIFSYFSASAIDFSSLERQLKNCNHCSGIEGELKTRLEKFILEEDFYEFDYNEKNEKYKFFIPKGSIVKHSEDKLNLTFYDGKNNSLLVNLRKRGSFFELDTDSLESLLYLANVENYESKVLKFRKRLLDRNKNFIKTREDIEYNGIKPTNTLEYIEEQMCPFVLNDSRIEETLEYPLYEFVFSDEDKVYSFFVPMFTRITTNKNSKDIFLLVSEDRCVDLFAEIAKLKKQPNSKFKLNTDELELLLKSRGVENYKNKVLKFRKQFLEKNKNLIK